MKKLTLLLVISYQVLALSQRAEGQLTVLHDFNDTLGSWPWGSLTLSRGLLYGMTSLGGTDSGCIFSIDTTGNNYRILHNFIHSSGIRPYYTTLLQSGGVMYGMTAEGGAFNDGVIFAIDTDGSRYTDLYDFNGTNGKTPFGSLIILRNRLYGMASGGGAYNYGVIFSMDTDGSGYTDMFDFNYTDGANPTGSLTYAGNKFYGMTVEGGTPGSPGVIFSMDTNGNNYRVLSDLFDSTGYSPTGSLTFSGGVLYGMTRAGGGDRTHSWGTIFSLDTNGGNFKVLFDFNNSDGYKGWGSLTLSGAMLYGMTYLGGEPNYKGNIFSIDTNSSVIHNLFSFDVTDGANPYGTPTISGDNLYGMTLGGGIEEGPRFLGVVFKFRICTFAVSATVSSLSCNGSANATATSSGGTSPYTYNWNNGQTNATATGLSSGTYSVNVTDSAGCTGSASVTITHPPILQDSINSQCATCCNCKGTTHVYVWGGTPPYTYSWSNGRTNDTLMSLASGSYTATITDSNGCIITDTVFVSKGDHVSASQTNVLCNGESDGSASVSVGSDFSYSWSPGGETTSSISGLSAGAYSVTATNIDTAGCSATYDFAITQPTALSLSGLISPYDNPLTQCADTMCYTVNFIATGGTPPYTYYGLFPGNGIYCTGIGPFEGTVDDANGCSFSITDDEHLTVGLSIRVQINNNVNCYGGNNGSATINANTGYLGDLSNDQIITWSPGGDTTQTVTNLSAGTYTITISNDLYPCIVSAVIAITQPPALILTADTINANPGNCDGKAWANVSGGTAPYTYAWTGGLATDTITNQCPGYYCCTITDANGCIDSVCTNIETSTGTKQLIMDNEQLTIYPNPNDGKFTLQINNGKLIIDNEKPLLEVYNVLGEKVYSELSIVNCQLLIDLSSQPNGIYFYRVLYEDGGLAGEGKLIINK